MEPAARAPLQQALTKLAGDAGLERELRAREPERARAFSWDRTAELTVQVYNEVASR